MFALGVCGAAPQIFADGIKPIEFTASGVKVTFVNNSGSEQQIVLTLMLSAAGYCQFARKLEGYVLN